MKTLIISNLISVFLAFIIDFFLGDPEGCFHPIKLIGRLITFFEKKLLKKESDKKKIIHGFILWICTGLITGTTVFLVLYIFYSINIVLGTLVSTIITYYIIAAKDLSFESMRVKKALDGEEYEIMDYNENKKKVIEKTNDDTEKLKNARYAVSMIVGRDVERLDEKGICKAAVETVAENLSDGVIAPIFYMIIGGPVLGYIYKSVNTMDSMIGYKNDKYLYFGRFAAIMDDIFNFIPSRLSALFTIAAAFILRLDAVNAWKVFVRDRFNHDSPNSAQTESAFAGALSLQLAGDAYYFGQLKKKKTIGDAKKEIDTNDIDRACKLMYVTALLFLLTFEGIYAVAIFVICE